MTFYEDLSPYSYRREAADVVNVGWLSAGYDFAKRTTAWPGLESLKRWTERAVVNRTRGQHGCWLCRDAFAGSGSAEVWVPSPTNRTIYAAPTLITHYIDVHGYDPPQVFLDAVVATERRASGFTQTDADERMDEAARATDLEPTGDTTLRLRPGDSACVIVRGCPGCAIRAQPVGAVAIESDSSAIAAGGTAAIRVRATKPGLHGLKIATRTSELVYFIIAE